MKNLSGTFIISAESLLQCPDSVMPEFPLIGRSNVGKSSFINALANNKKLAKTSNTPGKTRLINFFNFANKFMLADLPGYGYAKVSWKIRANWQKNLEEYLLKRKQITSLIQIIDARHEVQKNDIQMRDWVNTHNLPIITVVTKSDYLPKSKRSEIISKASKQLGGIVLPFSAVENRYNEVVLDLINELAGKQLKYLT